MVGCLDNLKIRLNSFQLCWNLTELGKMNCTIDFLEQKSTIPAGGRVGKGRVGSGRVVGWLDKLEIRLNSVQLCWNLTELGNNK